jgi:hypothetical protein
VCSLLFYDGSFLNSAISYVVFGAEVHRKYISPVCVVAVHVMKAYRGEAEL